MRLSRAIVLIGLVGCQRPTVWKLNTGDIVECKQWDMDPCGIYLKDCDDGSAERWCQKDAVRMENKPIPKQLPTSLKLQKGI